MLFLSYRMTLGAVCCLGEGRKTLDVASRWLGGWRSACRRVMRPIPPDSQSGGFKLWECGDLSPLLLPPIEKSRKKLRRWPKESLPRSACLRPTKTHVSGGGPAMAKTNSRRRAALRQIPRARCPSYGEAKQPPQETRARPRAQPPRRPPQSESNSPR